MPTPTAVAQTETDPLSRAISQSLHMAKAVPLVATSYAIRIAGGLADVTASRTFRNSEHASIEACLTFPMPVHAVLYGLEARIGDRTVKASSQARTQARANYEDAIDRGKTAVLHEELIKGVQLLSVGHIGPGTEITVTARFAVALARIDGRTVLRLPTTVGDVYGNSGLPDSDNLVHDGPAQTAMIEISCDAGEPLLLGGKLEDGKASLSLDAPIAIEIKDWKPRELGGTAADGRSVFLQIEPALEAISPIDAAVLVDHSGSMASPCGTGSGLTKHAATLEGFYASAGELRAEDSLRLWEFDDSVREVGVASGDHDGNKWRELIARLSQPAGGTEIGNAIKTVLQSEARDIILVTDGKSYALDVQQLACSGARFTVVLIGEDSLDANVGFLAALTGGEIFVPADADVAGAVRSALRSVRTRAGDPREAHLRRAGMAAHARWASQAPASGTNAMSRAVAAYAAALLLPALGEEAATRLAMAEGLVTHLTSLLLVDEQGEQQFGLPATRKVALPSPRTGMMAAYAAAPAAEFHCQRLHISRMSKRFVFGVDSSSSRSRSAGRHRPARKPSATTGSVTNPDFSALVTQIDWAAHGGQLIAGDLTGLSPLVADAIEATAVDAHIVKMAKRLALAPKALLIGLLARSTRSRDRHAARVDRALLGTLDDYDFTALLARFGLMDPAEAAE